MSVCLYVYMYVCMYVRSHFGSRFSVGWWPSFHPLRGHALRLRTCLRPAGGIYAKTSFFWTWAPLENLSTLEQSRAKLFLPLPPKDNRRSGIRGQVSSPIALWVEVRLFWSRLDPGTNNYSSNHTILNFDQYLFALSGQELLLAIIGSGGRNLNFGT